MNINNQNTPCPMCSSLRLQKHFTYDAPVSTEKNFSVTKENYFREMRQCANCGHFLEFFNKDQNDLYSGEYVSSTYRDADGIKRAFHRINSLDPLKSDNVGRVKYIQKFCASYWGEDFRNRKTLLDVGSGLGVFPYQMKKLGWDCTAIDMDQRLVTHHQQIVGIKSFCGDLRVQLTIPQVDLVTFNKVLEHTSDPIDVLEFSKQKLKSNGLIYVELPDGEGAEVEGGDREEFYFGHIHVFSFTSFSLLAKRAGLELICCERIREPSTKYTLRGFIRGFNE